MWRPATWSIIHVVMANLDYTIRVTFDDGTYEDRPHTCQVLISPRRADDHRLPLPTDVIDVRPYWESGCVGWGMRLVTARDTSLLDCATTLPAHGFRGQSVWAYRITGGRGKGEVLAGEWHRARVETTEEQIVRLVAERDEARRVYALYLGGFMQPTDFAEWKRLRAKAKDAGWLP